MKEIDIKSVCVCVHACECVCMHVSVCVHVCVCVGERDHTCMCVLIGQAGASPPSRTTEPIFIYIYVYVSFHHVSRYRKCFHTLLFHRHHSTFHGTQYSMCMLDSHGLGTRVRLRRERSRERHPLSQMRQGKPGFAEHWREHHASETAEDD